MARRGSAGVSVKHTEADGITVTVAPDDFTVVGYVKQDSMPPAIDGWDSQVLMRRNDADSADQTVYVYTDIAQDAGMSFPEPVPSNECCHFSRQPWLGVVALFFPPWRIPNGYSHPRLTAPYRSPEPLTACRGLSCATQPPALPAA